MENNLYQDNLEQFLKQRADNFRMYPSRRVWHGIYNDLHPSRKWPSLIIWVLLISSITYIGLTNKNQVSFSENNPPITASVNHEPRLIQKGASVETSISTDPKNIVTQQQNQEIPGNNRGNSGNNKPVLLKMKDEQPGKPSVTVSDIIKQPLFTKNDLANNTGRNENTVGSVIPDEIPGTDKADGSIAVFTGLMNEADPVVSISPMAKKTDAIARDKSIITNQISFNNDKEWIEDFAFHNKVSVSKWKTNVALAYYFTPSVGYRVLSMNTNYSPSSASLVAPITNNLDYKKALSQSAEINMELGSSIIYSYTKNWNIKAGIQLNYTNYAINAYELKHPTMTTLLLNDLENGFPVLDPRSTDLANSVGVSSKKLNNNTYQLSLPFGADLKIAGKNKIKWYAGATIQPTYIIDGNAYLISSDLKNYVTDKSLMRKWNLNAGFETFLSYKTIGGITINAGPQFRYQVFSTYNKQYTYDENLYNFGLKIGIITKF